MCVLLLCMYVVGVFVVVDTDVGVLDYVMCLYML